MNPSIRFLAISGVVLGLAWLSGCGPARFAAAVPQVAAEKHEGTIASVGNDQVMLMDDQAAPHMFLVTAATKITLDGKPARLMDLSIGQKATVTTAKQGEDSLVLSIEALTPQ